MSDVTYLLGYHLGHIVCGNYATLGADSYWRVV